MDYSFGSGLQPLKPIAITAPPACAKDIPLPAPGAAPVFTTPPKISNGVIDPAPDKSTSQAPLPPAPAPITCVLDAPSELSGISSPSPPPTLVGHSSSMSQANQAVSPDNVSTHATTNCDSPPTRSPPVSDALVRTQPSNGACTPGGREIPAIFARFAADDPVLTGRGPETVADFIAAYIRFRERCIYPALPVGQLRALLRTLVLSYDVICQWLINAGRRQQLWPQELQLGDVQLVYCIPKAHLPAHKEACVKYSFNFVFGMGRTDGEGVERGWRITNESAASTREMGDGRRHDTLDHLWTDHNYKKLVGLGKSFHFYILFGVANAVLSVSHRRPSRTAFIGGYRVH